MPECCKLAWAPKGGGSRRCDGAGLLALGCSSARWLFGSDRLLSEPMWCAVLFAVHKRDAACTAACPLEIAVASRPAARGTLAMLAAAFAECRRAGAAVAMCCGSPRTVQCAAALDSVGAAADKQAADMAMQCLQPSLVRQVQTAATIIELGSEGVAGVPCCRQWPVGHWHQLASKQQLQVRWCCSSVSRHVQYAANVPSFCVGCAGCAVLLFAAEQFFTDEGVRPAAQAYCCTGLLHCRWCMLIG